MKGASIFVVSFGDDVMVVTVGAAVKVAVVPELRTVFVLVTGDGAAVSVITVFPEASTVAMRITPFAVISTFFGGI